MGDPGNHADCAPCRVSPMINFGEGKLGAWSEEVGILRTPTSVGINVVFCH